MEDENGNDQSGTEEIEIVEFDENEEVTQIDEVEEEDENEKEEEKEEQIQTCRPIRRGCQKNVTLDERAKLQHERVRINFSLARQMKILTGAENLYRATANCKGTLGVYLNF